MADKTIHQTRFLKALFCLRGSFLGTKVYNYMVVQKDLLLLPELYAESFLDEPIYINDN